MQLQFDRIGRVEFDPMRVPQAARAAARGAEARRSRFEDSLDHARRDPPPRRLDDRSAGDGAPPAGAAPAPPEQRAARPAARRPADTHGTDHQQDAPAVALPAGRTHTEGLDAAQSGLSNTNKRGTGPVGHDAPAGRGAGHAAPHTGLAVTLAGRGPDGAATAGGPAGIAGSTPLPGAAAEAGKAAAGGQDPGRSAGIAGESSPARLRSGPGAAGFRTYNSQAMQMAEMARDSVFKQIAMRVAGDGSGEMRVLLEPRELGHLDLHVVVDKTGQMRLAITADRPEVAAMLDRNMGELRSVLAAQGLQLGEANVQHGDARRSGARGREHRPMRSGTDRRETHAAATPAIDPLRDFRLLGGPGRVLLGDTLDFWV